MQPPRGIYELKYFFSSGLKSDSGEMASSTSVRSVIEEMVRNEDAARATAGVNQRVQQAGNVAGQLSGSASDVRGTVGHLNNRISEFLARVRA